MNKNFKELSNAILANYSGGNKNSAACRQALCVCAVNSLLYSLGTSDPVTYCSYMRKVCR